MSFALLLLPAMLLDAAAGEPSWLWSRVTHPAVAMGRVVRWLDNRLNASPNRRLKGAITVFCLVAGACVLGLVISAVSPLFAVLGGAVLLAQRSLVEHVQAVGDALRLSVRDGQGMVSRIVSRDCRHMSRAQVARAAIESAAENLSDAVIAPAFWFLVAGLPGILVYKAVNTADSMIGYRNQRYEEFGWAAARLDDLLNLIPARLTGLAIAILSGQMGQWTDIVADARRHRSPNAGWPEAAMARALDVALAGPRSYDGQMQDFPFVNDGGREEIGPQEVDAAVKMLWRVWRLGLGVTLAIALVSALPLI